MNNPFIRYKIYSTTTDKSSDKYLIRENVRVLCLITIEDMDRLSFLKKVLSAAKINETDYQIFTLGTNESFSAADYNLFDQVDHLLCFGLSAKKIDINIPLNYYQSSMVLNTKIFQLPELGIIEADKNEKQQLWQLMKNEFIHE